MSKTGAPAHGHRTEDEKAEASRTLLALVRSAISNDGEAVHALLADAGERELRTIVYTAAGVLLDFFVRLSAAHALTDDEETRAFLRNGAVTDTVLADPAARAEIEATITATQARSTGQR